MAIFLTDFEVDAESLLPLGIDGYQTELTNGHMVTLENGLPDAEGNVASLLVTVVGTASALTSAAEEHRSILAAALDVLAYFSHARFAIVKVRQVVEWDIGLVERRFVLYGLLGHRYPPAHDLDAAYVQSLDCFKSAPNYVLKALRHFRYALLEEAPEDQFVRMWLALEILAVKSFDNTKRPSIKCRSCGAEARCATCNTAPPKMQSSKAPIEELVRTIVGAKAKEVYTRLFDIRNGLMHGQTPAAVEADAKVSWDKILRVTGRVTWQALKLLGKINGAIPGPVSGFAGDFMHKNIRVGANGTLQTPDGGFPSLVHLRSMQFVVTGHLRVPASG